MLCFSCPSPKPPPPRPSSRRGSISPFCIPSGIKFSIPREFQWVKEEAEIESRTADVATCLSVPYSLLHVHTFRGDDRNFSRGANEMLPRLKIGLFEFRRRWSPLTLLWLHKTKMALMNARWRANNKVRMAQGVHRHGSRRLTKVPKYGSWNCPIHNLHQFTTKTVMLTVNAGLVAYVQSRKSGRFKETGSHVKILPYKNKLGITKCCS